MVFVSGATRDRRKRAKESLGEGGRFAKKPACHPPLGQSLTQEGAVRKAEEAVRQAEIEGLTLLRADSMSGFRNVKFDSNKTPAFHVLVTRARPSSKRKHAGAHTMQVSLGRFDTAEEAALCYARTPEGRATAAAAATSAATPMPLTAEEALRQAETERLPLPHAKNMSGYRNVGFQKKAKARPYLAQVTLPGSRSGARILGTFVTAEEAALCAARAVADAEKAAAAAICNFAAEA